MRHLKRYFPILFLVLAVLVFFHKSVIDSAVPLPADIVVGVYYPWLDYKWEGYPAGVPVKNPLLSDVPSLIYPQKIYAMSQIKSGMLPLWNPLMFNGYPLMANFQSAVFNPFNVFFLLARPAVAWSWYIAFQPFLAGLFTYLLLRYLRLSVWPALFGAIAFAFSGFSLIWLEYGIHGYVAAYIPALLLFSLVFARSRRLLYGVLTAVVVSLQIFSGYPQITLYTLLLLPIWTWVNLAPPRKPAWFIKYLFFIGLGIALSAPQLLPGLELLKNSQRLAESVTGGSQIAFLPWTQMITLLAPDFFGNPTTGNFWGPGDYTNTSFYVGTVVFVLCLVSLFYWKYSHSIRFFWSLFLASLILALPTPISRAVSWLPLFSASTATRWFIMTSLSASVLSALGLQHLLSASRTRLYPHMRLAVIPAVVLLSCFLGFFAAREALLSAAADFPVITHTSVFQASTENFSVTLRNLILPGILAFCSGLLVFLSLRFKITRLTVPVFLLLSLFELLRFGWKYNPFFRSDLIFPDTGVLSFLRDNQGKGRFQGGDVIPLNMWLPYGLAAPGGYDAVYPLSWARYLASLDGGLPGEAKGRVGSIARYDSPLLDTAAVRYILALKRVHGVPDPAGTPSYVFDLPKLRPVFDEGSVVVLENTAALPESYLITAESGTVPVFPRSLANPKKFTFEVDSSSSSRLVNTTVDFPGWEASIDGRRVTKSASALPFQSVEVPAGSHRIEFTYRPLSFRIGLHLYLSASVLGAAVILNENRRAASRPRTARLV